MSRKRTICLNERIGITYEQIFKVIEEKTRKKSGRNGNLTKTTR